MNPSVQFGWTNFAGWHGIRRTWTGTRPMKRRCGNQLFFRTNSLLEYPLALEKSARALPVLGKESSDVPESIKIHQRAYAPAPLDRTSKGKSGN